MKQQGYRKLSKVVVITLALSGWQIGCSDRKETRYATAADARNDGAFERGWLPRATPSSATEIRELHDVDTNEGWGIFSFHGTDNPNLTDPASGCRAFISAITVKAPRVSWWPKYLSGTLTQSQFSKEGLELYQCDEPTKMFVAVNPKAGIGYFWY